MSHHDDMQERNVVPFPEQKAIRDQASEWIARLDQDSPDAATLREFAVWINKDVAHREAFERLATLWDDLNVLTQITMPGELKAIKKDGLQIFGISLDGLGAALTQVRFASVAVIGLLFASVFFSVQWQADQVNQYYTAVGEQQRIELSDGSVVVLNTNSRLRVDYSESRRGIVLLQGEAHFDVAHNLNRPFEVAAGEGIVRAVGTAFSVFYAEREVEVIVDDGVVEIDQAQIESSLTSRSTKNVLLKPKLRAGSAAVFDSSQPQSVELTHDVSLKNKLAWREGVLVFENDTLQALVEEVSRYTNTKIIVSNPSMKAMRVGGQFKIGDTQAVLDALELGFGIKVDRINNNQVYLSAK